MAIDDCVICGQQVRGDEAAVEQGGPLLSATWVPFVEDLRTSDSRLAHPACHARRHGLDDLLKVIHLNDLRSRDEIFSLIRQVDNLKGRGSN